MDLTNQSKQKPSKKRDYTAYSQGKDDPATQQIYEEINQQYRQLYLERQQQRQQQVLQDNPKSENEQKQSNPQNQKMTTNNNHQIPQTNSVSQPTNLNQNNQTMQGEQKKPNQMQNIHTNFDFKAQKSQFFINKLKQYPKEEQTPFMLGFSDIFCKNPFYEFYNEQPERQDVQAIFMTTYGYETELLLPILKSNKHFVLANDKSMHDKTIKDVIRENDGFKNWTLIHPPKDNSNSWGGAFHPKLWLIKFSNFLRVVIGSGNLHVSDWSVWSNCLWYQDFPLKGLKIQQKEMQQQKNQKWDFEGDFISTLTEIVKKMMPGGIGYQDLLKINLEEYDYSDVKIILVSSIVGRYTDIYKYGRGKMYKIMEAFKTPEQQQIKANNKPIQNDKIITYQCTSLGNIDNTFLNEFYTCATGNKPISDLKKDKANKKSDPIQIADKFKLIFPTAEYIYDETIYGPEYASPVILNQKYYEKDSFPKQIFHQFCSPDNYFYHTGAIPHLKIMTVTDSDISIKDDTLIYIGSHNFTAAAWGRFEKDYSQIYNSNTELGIIYPPMEGSGDLKQEIVNSLSFRLNAPKYSANMKPFVRNFDGQ